MIFLLSEGTKVGSQYVLGWWANDNGEEEDKEDIDKERTNIYSC